MDAKAKAFALVEAKKRVLAVHLSGGDWLVAAERNGIPRATAYRLVSRGSPYKKPRGGVKAVCVKMTVDAMAKLEEYVSEDTRHTLQDLKARLLSDMGVDVSTSTIGRSLHGMLYSLKSLRIEKESMNNSVNKEKRRQYAIRIQRHMDAGDMVVYHDESNYNIYLTRTKGWARVGERAVVRLPSSKGRNLHLQGGVSSGSGWVLLRTHDGAIHKEENARFVADLFVAAMETAEYQQSQSKRVVIVTDNAPAHSEVEKMARSLLIGDGIVTGSRLVVVHLAPYSPMLNPIEGCWSALKAQMKPYLASRMTEFLVRGPYESLDAHRMAILREAAVESKSVITPQLVLRHERHSLKALDRAERGEDMELGK